VGWVSQGYVFYHGEAYTSMNKKCIVIGAGINIAPARLALNNYLDYLVVLTGMLGALGHWGIGYPLTTGSPY